MRKTEKPWPHPENPLPKVKDSVLLWYSKPSSPRSWSAHAKPSQRKKTSSTKEVRPGEDLGNSLRRPGPLWPQAALLQLSSMTAKLALVSLHRPVGILTHTRLLASSWPLLGMYPVYQARWFTNNTKLPISFSHTLLSGAPRNLPGTGIHNSNSVTGAFKNTWSWKQNKTKAKQTNKKYQESLTRKENRKISLETK